MGNNLCTTKNKKSTNQATMGGDVTSVQTRRKVTLPPGYSQLVRPRCLHAYLYPHRSVACASASLRCSVCTKSSMTESMLLRVARTYPLACAMLTFLFCACFLLLCIVALDAPVSVREGSVGTAWWTAKTQDPDGGSEPAQHGGRLLVRARWQSTSTVSLVLHWHKDDW